jgi:hypothetical protein
MQTRRSRALKLSHIEVPSSQESRQLKGILQSHQNHKKTTIDLLWAHERGAEEVSEAEEVQEAAGSLHLFHTAAEEVEVEQGRLGVKV